MGNREHGGKDKEQASSSGLKGSGVKRQDLRLELKFLAYGEQNVTDRRVIFRILPCVVIYKSENRCIYGNHCLFRHADGEEKSSKRSNRERVLKEQLRF